MTRTLRGWFRRLLPGRIYWLRAPAGAPSGWVLFPLRPRRLACGLAGILEVHTGQDAEGGPDLARAVDRVLAGPLEFDHPGGFLGGPEVLAELERAARALRMGPRFEALALDPAAERAARELSARLAGFIAAQEEELARQAERFASGDLEEVHRRLVRAKDAAWALEREALGALDGVRELAGGRKLGRAALRELAKLHHTLENLNRLEIRGRDSAGVSLIFTFDPEAWERLSRSLAANGAGEALAGRLGARFASGAVAMVAPEDGRPGSFAIGWRVAAEIGKLGENVRSLRAQVKEDPVLAELLASGWTDLTCAAHTRWASNGIINLPNCHPLDNLSLARGQSAYVPPRGTIHVALNGDIDNYEQLLSRFERATGRTIEPQVTTDAKIIALEVERHYRDSGSMREAFRRAVSSFEGSAAIVMHTDLDPGKVYLSLKGSGQALYIGLLPGGGYAYASEVYGLVAQTARYVALDGEAPAAPDRPGASGQIAVLDAHSAGGLAGIQALFHDGTPLLLDERAVRTARITTRDIDRQEYEHFFLKEIHQSPASVEKTLLGKFSILGGQPVFNLGEEILPARLIERLASGAIRRLYLVGQGTAAVAADCIALFLREHLGGGDGHLGGGNGAPAVRGLKASELSGFQLRPEMSDTLVVAVTQSGTTTDTLRAVEMAGARGAATLAIVNRRDSAITEKVDGVYYTSDGRDIEMSVASTKAFYSQVAAGLVLSLRLAHLYGTLSPERVAGALVELRRLPRLMQRVLEAKDQIAASARAHAPRRRHWAVVGSGPNFAAAQEVRIKLSELCYKSIACDVVEDKKHIDLSSEPLILVLAAGNPEPVLADLAKDTAIFKAHKACPVVFASDECEKFAPYAEALVRLPRTDRVLSVVINTLAGHLWGYHAARAIDEGAGFLAGVRSFVVGEATAAGDLYELAAAPAFRRRLRELELEFLRRLRAGRFNAGLPADVSGDLALLFGWLSGGADPAGFAAAFGQTPTPENLFQALIAALSRGIDEQSRPIDAIKHQAKTVTVGTSRLEELPRGCVFDAAREAGVKLADFHYEDLAELKRIQVAVARVTGTVLYRVSGLPADGVPGDRTRIEPIRRTGLAAQLRSRTEGGAPLLGTKRTIVRTRQIYVGIGRGDSRQIAIVPLYDAERKVWGLLLAHLEFQPRLELEEKIRALGVRYEDLKNAVIEANRRWDDALLEPVPPEALFTRSIEALAESLGA